MLRFLLPFLLISSAIGGYEYDNDHDFSDNFRPNDGRNVPNRPPIPNLWPTIQSVWPVVKWPTNKPTTMKPTATPTLRPTCKPTASPTLKPVTAKPVTAAPIPKSPPFGGIPTVSPQTARPVTASPVTASPTTAAPVTASPTTAAPVTESPTTLSPTTAAPVTDAPVTASPTTASPVTESPTSLSPTAAPVTDAPVSASPTTASPSRTPIAGSPPFGGIPTASPVQGSPTLFPTDPTVIDICFNKFVTYNNTSFRLNMSNFPIGGDTGRFVKTQTTAISVITADDPEIRGIDVVTFIQAVGGLPSFPCNGTSAPFWEDLKEVVEEQINRRAGRSPDPSRLTLPDIFSFYNVTDIAECVHDEFPGFIQIFLLTKLLKQGIQWDFNVMPFRCNFDFVGSTVRLSTMNTWAVGTVSPINFAAKWYVGRVRPEEIAWKIASGALGANDGVPLDLIQMIQSMNLTKATDFGAYPEGCPRHPAWPAMHSAASSMAFWLSVIANLTQAQFCQALRLDYLVAYARTVAGVHYPEDNYAGLNMGQEILAYKLPSYMAKMYGSNFTAVQQKVQATRFDWKTFDPVACTVQRIPLSSQTIQPQLVY